jgi:hypothetical protein
MKSRLLQIVSALCVLGASVPVSAAQRTFVSGSGVDSNPCTLTLPCRSFATAIGQTASGGEVIVLDSAGYGPVAITQSVSIIAPAGLYGGISILPGIGNLNHRGVYISGSNIVVALLGLSIVGQGGIDTAVQFDQGSRLTVERCEIANVANGIDAAAPNSVVDVKSTVIRDAHYGFAAIAFGGTEATLDGLHIVAKNAGISALYGGQITVTNTVVVMESGGAGISSWANTGDTSDVMVSHSTISGGDYGFRVNALPGGTARVVSDGNAINNTKIAAFSFVGSGGTEQINTSGTNTLGSSVAAVVVGGALTPIGQH